MTTEVRFYHLERISQTQILPVLISKALGRGHRIIVKLRDEGQVIQMNDHLWTYSANSFLPHGAAKNGNAKQQPVWLTDRDENPNDADVIILCEGTTSEEIGNFTLCCEMINGRDHEAISAARTRWKAYKEQGFDITYWQQNDNGGWDKKA